MALTSVLFPSVLFYQRLFRLTSLSVSTQNAKGPVDFSPGPRPAASLFLLLCSANSLHDKLDPPISELAFLGVVWSDWHGVAKTFRNDHVSVRSLLN